MELKKWILYLGRKGKHDIGQRKKFKKKITRINFVPDQKAGN